MSPILYTPSSALANRLVGKEFLIFDFDGTIANTSPLHAQAFAETLAPYGISVCYQHIAGLRTADALHTCFHQSRLEPPSASELKSLVDQKQQRVRALIRTSLQPILPMDSFLRWAQTRFQMGLVTSGSRGTVESALHKLEYQSFFSNKIFAEDVKNGKPDPEGFELALTLKGCNPGQSIVFEDSAAGFLAAKSAKLDCVDVTCPTYALAE